MHCKYKNEQIKAKKIKSNVFQGDSGGPLTDTDGELVGISSWVSQP